VCRNIKMLFNFEPPATPREIEAAALQFVRKVSGATRVAAANQPAFDRAVREVTASTARLLSQMVPHAPPRSRAAEAEKARARWRAREARIRVGVEREGR
jgi:hypothetical protein